MEAIWWQFALVFVGAFLFDVVPFPFPPAFSIMIPLQIIFHLNPWLVVVIGVAGSILGRYVLTLYIPSLSSKIFNVEKNKDVQFLGDKMKEKGWKSQLLIVAYSILPLPTTPLFLAAGMARLRAIQIIPAFFIGKFTSDSVAVHLGKFTYNNTNSLLQQALSWKTITGLVLSVLFLCALLFIDWRTLIEKRTLLLNFKVWKKNAD